MTRRPARVRVPTQPGATQLTSLLDAKPCTSTIGSPFPSSRKAISTPSWANLGMPRPYDPSRRRGRLAGSHGAADARRLGLRKIQAPREDDMPRILLACLATLIFSGGTASAQISDDVVKIGVLTDLSGPAATATGPGSVAAAQMAVDDFGGTVLGKPIELISADHQIKPDVAAGIAREWYDRDQVDLIVDVPVSAVGLAGQNVANDRKRLFITHSTGTADFHGKFCSPYSMQRVFDTHALAVGTAQEVVKRGGDTWFFLTADYAFGHSLERDATQVITQNGGKVLGSVAHPFATPDLSSFILQAQASKAKIIGIASGPPDNVNAIKLGGEFGIFQGGQQMAGLLVLITDVNALGLKAAQGLVLTTSFYWDMDDKTRDWSKRFFAKMNRMPTMWQGRGYSSGMHY